VVHEPKIIEDAMSSRNPGLFILWSLLVITAACGCGGCASSRISHEQAKDILSGTMNQATNPQSSLYCIQAGDQVKISIAEYPEFDTTATVSGTGTIALKIVGEIQAAGLTRDQLSAQLILKLSDFVRTSIHPIVTVVSGLAQKVAILGAVARQDNYPITSEMSLLQVLALAGGVTAEADVQRIRIIRGGDTRNIVEVDFTQYLERGRTTDVPLIRAGDIVFVPREENVIRELSNFFRDAIFLFSVFAVSK
jgi:polysaccharide export outer membrane protein